MSDRIAPILDDVRTYRELFAVVEFRAIFIAQCCTVAAASVGGLAMGVLSYSETGSALLSGLAMFGGPLVRLFASWFLVAASDTIRPRTALVAVAALTAAVDAVQAVPSLPLALRFVLVILPWLALSATGGTLLALVADIVPSGGYVFGRATLNIAVGVMQIVGYGVAGVLLLHFGPAELFAGAAVVSLLAVVTVRFGVADHDARADAGRIVRRSHQLNTALLRSPVVRPVLLALWVPNGLVVGCESLFVPYGQREAGYLLCAAAAGMLVGDVVVGRFVSPHLRERLVGPLRYLLAAPYLIFLTDPPLALAAAASLVASVGYAASLPLQERLVTWTDESVRGQVLGLNSTGMLAGQGVAAVAAGGLAQLLGADRSAAALVMGLFAAVSLVVSTLLIPGLRRSRMPVVVAPGAPIEERVV